MASCPDACAHEQPECRRTGTDGRARAGNEMVGAEGGLFTIHRLVFSTTSLIPDLTDLGPTTVSPPAVIGCGCGGSAGATTQSRSFLNSARAAAAAAAASAGVTESPSTTALRPLQQVASTSTGHRHRHRDRHRRAILSSHHPTPVPVSGQQNISACQLKSTR